MSVILRGLTLDNVLQYISEKGYHKLAADLDSEIALLRRIEGSKHRALSTVYIPGDKNEQPTQN